MKTEYKKGYAITYTDIKQRAEMDLTAALTLVQNMMTEYFGSMKSDNIRLKKNNKAIWVVTRAKMHINRYPSWCDTVQARSYTTRIKPIRVEVESTFKDAAGDVFFSARQECCVIDVESRKLRRISTIDYPRDMETEDSVLPESYSPLKGDFTEDDCVYRQKIFSSDVDYSNHTNNVSYLKFIMNTLSCGFLEENRITDFEIHYISESKEGQILNVYKKEKDNSMEFLIKEGDREIVRAGLSYEKVSAAR